MSALRQLNVFQSTKATPDLLADVGIFSQIKGNDAALSALCELMHSIHFKKGENILIEGEEGTKMYVLIEGDAGVFKKTPGGDEYKVAILRSADHASLGEGALIDADRRTASVRAENDCICFSLDRSEFDEFAERYPQFALPIYRKIATSVMTRLRKTNEDMLLLYNALVTEIRGR